MKNEYNKHDKIYNIPSVHTHNNYDKLFKIAVQESVKDEFELINNEMALSEPHVFSDEFNRKMEKLLKFSKKPYFTFINTFGKRVAVITITIFASLLITVFSVEALRTPVVNFFVNIYETFTIITFDNTANNFESNGITYEEDVLPTTIEEYLEPAYIPGGYSFSENIDLEGINHIYWLDENQNEIGFEQFIIENTTLGLDTEGVELEDITINGNKGWFYSNKGVNNVIWIEKGYGFQIYGVISKNELLEMTKLKEIEKK